MANLPGSIKNLNTLLGEQLTEGSGGGGGGAEPLIVGFKPAEEVTQGDSQLDKTFGEIRRAIISGRPVLIVAESSGDTWQDMSVNLITDFRFTIGEESASGNVGNYDVSVDEAPFTLDRLDASYPYQQS